MATFTHPKYNVEWTVYDGANNSTAKQQFSFPKSLRFKQQKPTITDKIVGYNLPSTIAGRSTSFGFGERSVYKTNKDSPSPHHYDVKSSFDYSIMSSKSSKRAKNMSFCFGTGREAFTKVVLPAKMNIPDTCVPGPGSYDVRKDAAQNDKRKFTIGPKYIFDDPVQKELKKNVPGPGYYPDTLQIDKIGKYVVSTYSNSRAPNFSPSERFKAFTMKPLPGPGYYNPPGMMDQNNGQQIISQYRTVKVRKFGTAQRPNLALKLDTPGPGQYRPPSDFGYLDFKPKTQYLIMRSRLNRSALDTANEKKTIDFESNSRQDAKTPFGLTQQLKSQQMKTQDNFFKKRNSVDDKTSPQTNNNMKIDDYN